MAAINLTNIKVLNNPAKLTDQVSFEITFECLSPLQDDLEWKITYIGSSKDPKDDQVLDSILLGPLQCGAMRFVFEADGPNVSKIPKDEILGITAILITCSYHEQEFIRIGYYVNNQYTDNELIEDPPEEPVIEAIERHILQDKPRITRYPIDWRDNKAGNEDEKSDLQFNNVNVRKN